jgi:hypothetical protein
MVRHIEYDQVCDLLSKGAKLMIARDPAGRHRLKLKTGPFGLITKRFTLDQKSMDRLRRDFKIDRD